MKVLFCWTHLSGYASACFRELARRPGVTLRVLHFASAASAPFDDAAFSGFDRRPVQPETRDGRSRILDEVREFSPDVLVVSGWASAAYRALPSHPEVRGRMRLVLSADTPARFDLRQRVARLLIGRYLDRFDAIVVPGERGLQVMRYWGVPFERLHVGLYGVDVEGFSGVFERRRVREWPRRFLFAGRLVESKGAGTLARAYGIYRGRVQEPWPLVCHGTGPLQEALGAVPGIEYGGFLQPSQLQVALEAAGIFVLPSWMDPWPLAIVEAAAAGLPILCTLACGSSAELVRTFHNGLLVPPRDPELLAAALEWFHARHRELAAMGERSAALASAYSAQRWADRWTAICGGVPSAV